MPKLILPWLGLLVLLALEIGASLLPLSASTRPLILIPALAMVGVILTCFMQVGCGPTIVRLFLTAGALWLLMLLALGSLDPLTRIVYPVASM